MTALSCLDLFSGIGGLALGMERAGAMEPAAFCEIDSYCRRVLAKHWPKVRQYDDVRTLSAQRLASDGIAVDAICGGFPCQDISYAGFGAGLSGNRSSLFYEFARLIGELGPQVVVVENVTALLDRGMAEVLGTLSDLGFDAEWDTVTACSVGHTHVRSRVFIVAYSDRFDGRERLRHSLARSFRTLQASDGFARARARQNARLENPSELYRGANGLPHGMDRNRGVGNAVAPDVAEVIGRAIAESRVAA